MQQPDGSLDLYKGSCPADRGALLWSSGFTTSQKAYSELQPDGNLVTYIGVPGDKSTPKWSSNTYGKNVAVMQVTDDPSFELTDSSGNALWKVP